MDADTVAARSVSFGPFRLFPSRRLLLDGDQPLRLGSRALDILIALVERAGELVGKNQLMRRVWPDTNVVEDNLAVHVAALRRALGDGNGGNRYIITIPGRGYCFTAPTTEMASPPPAIASAAKHNLPGFLVKLIGRDHAIATLAEQPPATRLITIVGPGGIGKTLLALALAEKLLFDLEYDTWMVDLAPLDDARLVPAAVSAALGIEVPAHDPVPELLGALSDRKVLLLIDNCEHVIEAVAYLVNALLRRAPGLRILATSREPLRIEGERIYRLAGLESPPPSSRLTAVDALESPAVRLFVERATASIGQFRFDNADAPLVAEICRNLDGIPLAIELAAARVDMIGIRGLAARMKGGLPPLKGARRTAPRRQRTMQATLDWSYALLSEREKTVLRRLSTFPGSFSLTAGTTIAADRPELEGDTLDQILELVAKSLVIADAQGTDPQLRLFETTRAYARGKLAESGESDGMGRRHAEYCIDLPKPANIDAPMADPIGHLAPIDARRKFAARNNARPASPATKLDGVVVG